MVRTYKRKSDRQSWSKLHLKQAIQELGFERKEKRLKVSYKTIANKYYIPLTTLINYKITFTNVLFQPFLTTFV